MSLFTNLCIFALIFTQVACDCAGFEWAFMLLPHMATWVKADVSGKYVSPKTKSFEYMKNCIVMPVKLCFQTVLK
jgi:hypothetical protein